LELVDYLTLINQGKEVDIKIDENEITKSWNRVCVLNMLKLKRSILKEGHRS